MRIFFASVGLITLFSGCAGPTCQNTCEHIYGSSPGQCNQSVAGQNRNDLIRACQAECKTAVAVPGPMGSYNPEDRVTNGATISLDNEQQAAAWMDCVENVSCENLDNGYCAPIR